ncbi:30S ribosomal protein S19e [Halanaeroarchaeum sulfurireducens]|uniref:Small ribosomal subunit protein eS19 n=1 Tax=Halanaeroarchaeum sulfurireducens TaxID=1604004 RepID=A0A0F7P936_9EURY|nr:30S ribosomal protein S19e [Halanaeroarchaeum sulfurireducens]AKH96705.1 30S ribosomal protein S19e [Halanaeroarchaeum sulfurireducens]ALG81107.1 30S ribosomal protein S19e [Halanaeroarchaeum sulfurireducens]
MVTLYDAPADELIEELSAILAERLEEPEWASYTKTGTDRELPPEQEDFWFRRAASVLRKVAMDGPVGVESLSSAYGDTKRGSNRYQVAPAHKTDASKKIIRTILQQLEEEGLVSQEGSAGRIATPEGRSLLDGTAGDVIEDLGDPALERYV